MTLTANLLSAEEYARLPENGRPSEQVQGKVIERDWPFPRHGQICGQIGYLLRRFLEDHDLGHVVGNNAGIVTRRDPDSVRGADVAYYSYLQMPRGPLPQGYLPVPPELVFEVRSLSDRWRDMHTKVAEYLEAGVKVVCVVDEQTQTAHVFHPEQPPRRVAADEELTLPEVLGDFRTLVRDFFE